MKNRIIVLLVCLLLVGFLVFLFFSIKNSDSLNNTSVIIVRKTDDDGNLNEEKITNKKDINKIIEIIDSKKIASIDDEVPYREMPHYKLLFLDKKDSVIMEIGFFYYSENLNWIMIDDSDEYYEIDSTELLKLIE